MKFISGLSFVIGLTLISGCMDITSEGIKGTYQGSWSKEGATEVVPIHAAIGNSNSNDSGLSGTVECGTDQTKSKTPCHFQFEIQKTKRTVVALQMTGDATLDVALVWDHSDKNRPCLSDDTNELCLSDDQIAISFLDSNGKKNTFTLAKTPDSIPTPTPIPGLNAKAYKVSELLDLTAHHDFGTRIEYQRYLETRYNAKAAVLALTPHVSLGTVGNLLTGLNPSSFISVVGDLLPFLLPNRWLQAKEADLASQAEFQSSVIIRLNALLFTETLAYYYLRDLNAIQALREERGTVNTLYKQIHLRETLGQLPYGSKDDLANILNAIDQALLQLQYNNATELQQLALAVGFKDPNAITSVIQDGDRSVTHPILISESELQKQSTAKAHEVLQADLLYQQAKVAKVERYFTWLDPTAPPTLGLGAALFPATKNATAQIEEFRLMEEQTTAQLTNKASTLFSTLTFALKNQSLVEEALVIEAARVKRVREHLSYGTDFVLADLVGALQDQVTAQVNKVGNEALYQSTEAQIDRLLLRGFYQKYDDNSDSTRP